MKRNIQLFTAISLLLFFFSAVSAQQGLVINEFLASNDSCYADEFGGYDDWVEIYNAGTEAVDIGGMYITDDLSEPTAWQIPDTSPQLTTIEPGGFLVLWCDKETEQGVLHVKLKLSSSGEQIGLFAADGVTPIDTLTFGAQTTDVSYGRMPDGSDHWEFFDNPTPGQSNSATGVEDEKNDDNIISSFRLSQNYPNPFNPETYISYRIPQATKVVITVYNLQGKVIQTLVNEQQDAGHYSIKWNGADNAGVAVASGIYLYRIKAGKFEQAKKMILVR